MKLHIYQDTDGYVLHEEGKARKVFFTLEGLIKALKEYPNLDNFEPEVDPELLPIIIKALS